MDESLIPFLRPRGVAVVGVSASPEKLGYGIARNILGSGYSGAIHLVSQRGGELFGRTLYLDITQVPDPVDLMVLAVPSTSMPEVLRLGAQRGIPAAILLSSGFREAGPEGAALEQECLAVAQAHGMRLLGPNCIGVIDTHLPLDTSFLQPPMPERGGIAFVSHSGAFCAAIIDWAREEGFGFSQVVSLGNQVDITETDMLAATAEDEHTRTISLYMEGVRDGRRFVDVARGVVRRKPVVALKVGRSEPARRAAASHTGALAASDDAFNAAFSKAGIFRAASAEEMFDWARALGAGRLPQGRNVAILTDAGGPGVIAADALEPNGLALAPIGASTRHKLAEGLPAAASVQNPVDMLASASPEDYARSLRILLDDAAVDSALVILPPPPMFAAEEVTDAILPVISASEKPVLVALMGSRLIKQARQALNCANVPTYPFPERAASALGILARRAEFLRTLDDEPAPPQQLRSFQRVSNLVEMSPDEIMASCGIATAQMRLAESAERAASLAEEFGYPVVLKIDSPDIQHKSDAGGVLTSLDSRQAVLKAYAQILANTRAIRPDARVRGIHVQRQILHGQEVILGAIQDPTFGPMVMFGSGGTEAEGLHDVAFALAPLSAQAAAGLIQRTWAGRRLDGYRNIPRVDKAAVQDALIRLSWLAWEHPEIKEVEINPLRVLDEGAVALDVRVIL